MATLREMLVKIYQPKQGIIEYGPNGSTQDGATGLAVLGGNGQGGEEAQQGIGGGIDFPELRYAGLEAGATGGGGGGGGFDFSNFDFSDPQQQQLLRDYLESGGGGAEDRGLRDDYDPNAFVNPALAKWVGRLAPFPLSLIGSLGAAGMRAHNAGLLDEAAMAAGGTGLSFGQQLGALFGGNDYGDYDYRGPAAALNAAGEGRAAGTGGLGESAGGWADAVVGLGPREAQNVSWSGALDSGGGSSYGGGAPSRSSYRDTRPDRRGARDRGSGGANDRGGGGAGPGGGPGGQSSGSDPGGWRHEGGPIYGEPGEEVGITALAGEFVMSPEAVEHYGMDNLAEMNDLAKMMRRQKYPTY